jgi:hypothetical protein
MVAYTTDPYFGSGSSSSGNQNLGFNFNYFGSIFTYIVVSVNSYLSLNGGSNNAIYVSYGSTFSIATYGKVCYRQLGN